MRMRIPWLILLGGISLAACSKPQPATTDFARELPKIFSDAVDEAVADPERAQSAKNQAIKASYAIEAYVEDAWRLHTQAFDLNADYHSRADDYEVFLKELQSIRSKRQSQVIESMLQAREGVSPEEWQAIHDLIAAELRKRHGD